MQKGTARVEWNQRTDSRAGQNWDGLKRHVWNLHSNSGITFPLVSTENHCAYLNHIAKWLVLEMKTQKNLSSAVKHSWITQGRSYSDLEELANNYQHFQISSIFLQLFLHAFYGRNTPRTGNSLQSPLKKHLQTQPPNWTATKTTPVNCLDLFSVYEKLRMVLTV